MIDHNSNKIWDYKCKCPAFCKQFLVTCIFSRFESLLAESEEHDEIIDVEIDTIFRVLFCACKSRDRLLSSGISVAEKPTIDMEVSFDRRQNKLYCNRRDTRFNIGIIMPLKTTSTFLLVLWLLYFIFPTTFQTSSHVGFGQDESKRSRNTLLVTNIDNIDM